MTNSLSHAQDKTLCKGTGKQDDTTLNPTELSPTLQTFPAYEQASEKATALTFTK